METLAAVAPSILAGIAYDPTIRGILAVGVGLVVLAGSAYLLLGTNLGNRLGFLLALTGFFAWMTIMGMSWWLYGIGMQGSSPEWKVVEFNAGDPSQAATEPVRDLDVSLLPQEGGQPDYDGVSELSEVDPEAFHALNESFEEATGGWSFLPPSDGNRAEAEGTVSAELPECAQCDFDIESASDYVILGGFDIGGKEGLSPDPTLWERVRVRVMSALTITNPKHYAVVQVQKVIPQDPVVGEAPPTPEPDPSEPVISVVMIRDIGDLRFPSAMITIGSVLILGLLCWILHQREKVLEANLSAAETTAGKPGAGV